MKTNRTSHEGKQTTKLTLARETVRLLRVASQVRTGLAMRTGDPRICPSGGASIARPPTQPPDLYCV